MGDKRGESVKHVIMNDSSTKGEKLVGKSKGKAMYNHTIVVNYGCPIEGEKW